MRTTEKLTGTLTENLENQKRRSEITEASTAVLLKSVYNEMADVPVVDELDIVEQLAQNISRLEDLQARLSFMMREVRSLTKA